MTGVCDKVDCDFCRDVSTGIEIPVAESLRDSVTMAGSINSSEDLADFL